MGDIRSMDVVRCPTNSTVVFLLFVTETQNHLSTRHIQHTQAVGLSTSGDQHTSIIEHHNSLKTKKHSQ